MRLRATGGTPGVATARPLFDPHVEGLDNRIGEQRFRDLVHPFESVLVGRPVELDLETLSLPYARDPGEPQLGQLPGDGLALRIEDLRLEHDVDDDTRHGPPPFLPCRTA